jgi:hypothetical protein
LVVAIVAPTRWTLIIVLLRILLLLILLVLWRRCALVLLTVPAAIVARCPLLSWNAPGR